MIIMMVMVNCFLWSSSSMKVNKVLFPARLIARDSRYRKHSKIERTRVEAKFLN